MSSEVMDNLQFMSSTNVHSTSTIGVRWRRRRMPPLLLAKKELVQVALLQIHGGDGAHLTVLLNLIGVSMVHFFLICSVWCTNSFVICRTFQTIDKKSDLLVPICPSHCTSVQSFNFQLRITTCWVFQETIVNFFQISYWDISFEHCGLWNAPSVLQFYRVEHVKVVSSWQRSAGLGKRPSVIDENVGWLHFPSRDVHKIYRQFLIPTKKAFWVLHL